MLTELTTMTVTPITTSVCKTLKSLGIVQPGITLDLCNHITKMINNNGPEYLLSRISSLSQWRKDHLSGKTSSSQPWFKVKRRKDGTRTPADPIGSRIWRLKDKTFFAVLGGIRKSITLSSPSPKQMDKWVNAIRCPIPSHSSSSYLKNLNPSFRKKMATMCNRLLDQRWRRMEAFTTNHLTGCSIPTDIGTISVRSRTNPYGHPSLLFKALELTLGSVPWYAWEFLGGMWGAKAYSLSHPYYSLLSYGNRRRFNMGLLQSGQGRYLREGPYAAYVRHQPLGDPPRDNIMYSVIRGLGHPVGQIGFIQERAGKLRTIANPNRFLQYLLTPLGETLSDLIRIFPGCFVYNQEDGIKHIQARLKEGVMMSSFDMSSATDKLDFQKFLFDLWGPSYLEENGCGILSYNLNFFSSVSKSPWYVPIKVARMLGLSEPIVSWSVGQPLGLRPSFPLLTLMNCIFAEEAIKEVWDRRAVINTGKHLKDLPYDNPFVSMCRESRHKAYACVGDDLVIESQYANEYMKLVRLYNGEISLEKGMNSHKYAEFCSQLVTATDSYPLKPSFLETLDGTIQNIERFSISGLRPKVRKWVKDLHSQVAAISIPGVTKYRWKNSSKPMNLSNRVALSLISDITAKPLPDNKEVTLNTLYYQALEEVASCTPGSDLQPTDLDSPWARFPGLGWERCEEIQKAARLADFKISSYRESITTSVVRSLPASWDKRRSQPSVESSSLRLLKDTQKMLANTEFYTWEGDMVTAIHTLKDGTLLEVDVPKMVDPNMEQLFEESVVHFIRSVMDDSTQKVSKIKVTQPVRDEGPIR